MVSVKTLVGSFAPAIMAGAVARAPSADADAQGRIPPGTRDRRFGYVALSSSPASPLSNTALGTSVQQPYGSGVRLAYPPASGSSAPAASPSPTSRPSAPATTPAPASSSAPSSSTPAKSAPVEDTPLDPEFESSVQKLYKKRQSENPNVKLASVRKYLAAYREVFGTLEPVGEERFRAGLAKLQRALPENKNGSLVDQGILEEVYIAQGGVITNRDPRFIAAAKK